MLRLEEGARKALEELEKCNESQQGALTLEASIFNYWFFPYIRESFGIPVSFLMNKVVNSYCMCMKLEKLVRFSSL